MTVKTQMKGHMMRHLIRVYTVCCDTNIQHVQRKIYNIILKLEMCPWDTDAPAIAKFI